MITAQNANTHFPRSLAARVSRDMDRYPVVAVMGARQVGKSTLCRGIAASRGLAYRTLDDRETLEQAQADADGLLDDLGDAGAFLDEVQRAPGLFLAIKQIVDRDQRPGRYLLSGSNQPRVSSSIGDSLLGRAAYRTLRPLTLSELRLDEVHPGWSFLLDPSDAAVLRELEHRAAINGKLDWRDVAATGGFPRVVRSAHPDRTTLLNDYIEVFSRRDIRDVLGVESGDRFETFLRLTAARIGQELNFAGLSRDLGLAVTTVRRWVDALARSYLVEMVPSYSRNAGQRVVKAPKLFMVDSALALAAARETVPTGFHLENLAASDLAVWKDSAPGRGLHHWRLASGQEVDFVLEENGQLLPVELKSAESVTAGDTRHLRRFRTDHANSPRGLILSSDDGIRFISNGIIAAPWWSVL